VPQVGRRDRLPGVVWGRFERIVFQLRPTARKSPPLSHTEKVMQQSDISGSTAIAVGSCLEVNTISFFTMPPLLNFSRSQSVSRFPASSLQRAAENTRSDRRRQRNTSLFRLRSASPCSTVPRLDAYQQRGKSALPR